LHKINGGQQAALEADSPRLLVIPVLTKLAAASPFHCRLVSPGSKESRLNCPPNHVDNCSFYHPERSFRDGCHTGVLEVVTCLRCPDSNTFFVRPLVRMEQDRRCSLVDKPRRPPENRRFSSVRQKALP
jgi:hypothetical protein